MITLEQVCENLVKDLPFPIESITETETRWALFSDFGESEFGTLVPTADKKTGEFTVEWIYDYLYQPQVPVPEQYRPGVWHKPKG